MKKLLLGIFVLIFCVLNLSAIDVDYVPDSYNHCKEIIYYDEIHDDDQVLHNVYLGKFLTDNDLNLYFNVQRILEYDEDLQNKMLWALYSLTNFYRANGDFCKDTEKNIGWFNHFKEDDIFYKLLYEKHYGFGNSLHSPDMPLKPINSCIYCYVTNVNQMPDTKDKAEIMEEEGYGPNDPCEIIVFYVPAIIQNEYGFMECDFVIK